MLWYLKRMAKIKKGGLRYYGIKKEGVNIL